MLDSLFLIAVCVLLLATFGEASLNKSFSREVPDWFRELFASTWLGRLPPGLLWWGIALAELTIAGLVVASLISQEAFADGRANLLEGACLLASAVCAGFCFGQRVALDFASAANSFYYSALSLLLWYAVRSAA